MDLADVLWIGGPQASGKSSVARALARCFDLQLYNVDHRTWVHEPRMPRSEFASLSMDERWVDATPAQMLDWFVSTSRHRFRLVLEDLRGLPDAPGAVVEGPQLFPTSVAAVLRRPDQALFLLPDPDEQRARLLARGPLPKTSDGTKARANATERDLMVTGIYDREARDLRLTTWRVDRPIDELIARAVEHFRPIVDGLPRGGDLGQIRRFENDLLATQVRLYRESLLPIVLDDSPVRFACECGSPGCTVEIELTMKQYEAISAAGDRSPLRRPTP
jgi:hypothetical protein